jgi:ubiquinone/menaquinone biosynthesis C-methylase UbiE
VRPQELRPELLDLDRVSDSSMAANLADLSSIYRWFGGRAARSDLEAWLAGRKSGSRLWLLDVACGGADGSREILALARRRGLAARAVGLDRNPRILRWARRQARSSAALDWVCGDAASLPFPDRCFDLVYCSLYLHHLPDPAVAAQLQELWRVSRGVLVAIDLRRSMLAWWLAALIGRLSLRNYVTLHDGLVSIRQSFRGEELRDLAGRAGLSGARVSGRPWFRLVLWAERA